MKDSHALAKIFLIERLLIKLKYHKKSKARKTSLLKNPVHLLQEMLFIMKKHF